MRKFVYNNPSLLNYISIIALGCLSSILFFLKLDFVYGPALVFVIVISSVVSLALKGDILWGLSRTIRSALLQEGDCVNFITRADNGCEEHTGKIIKISRIDIRCDNTKDEIADQLFCWLDNQKVIRVQNNETGTYHTIPRFFVGRIL